MSDHIRLDRADGIRTITLDRPAKKNALTRDMYRAMADAIDGAEHDPQTRCIVVQAEGDMFTAGNDLADFASFDAGAETEGNPFILAIGNATTPIVAAVHGRAVGIGLTMLLHCDAVFVSEDAALTAPFVNLALVPEAASSLLLVERIGYVRAFAVFALGEAIDARHAVEWGLANAVVPRDELRSRARAAAVRLAALAPQSLVRTKTLMRDREAIHARMMAETPHFRAQLQSAEAREAFAAFAQKRTPSFTTVG